MLDIKFIRENVARVKQATAQKRANPEVVDAVLRVDEERRQLMVKVDELRAQRNQLNRQLKKGRTDELITQSTQLKTELQDLEPALKQLEETFQTLLLQVPNVPADDVPVGPDESGNVEVANWGQKPAFEFDPKDHITLATDLGIVDFDRGAKVAGYRGYFLKNEGVILHMGIMRYALDKLMEKGFTAMIPPIVTRKETFVNSGHFPWGEKTEVYAVQTEDDPKRINPELGKNYAQADLNLKAEHYLAGTAEVPLVSYHAQEVLNEADLPLKYAGFSPCYRAEIGSYGKDTRGFYRIHEFMKIEQVILCTNDYAESTKWHEALRSYSEEMLQELELPYRVLLMCTGDMGEPQIKKYDIETWMPGRKAYGETMSDSIMGDFQARRANIRYQAKDGSLKFVHMLNNTALASPRILVALLENRQQADGSVKIPQALQAYVGFDALHIKKN